MTEDLLIEHAGNVESLTRWVDTAPPKRPAPAFIRAQLAAMRDAAPRAKAAGMDAAWASLPVETRTLLLAESTDRPLHGAARVRWRDMTEAERARLGARARGLVRDLEPVARTLMP